jgi:hypothetical protein
MQAETMIAMLASLDIEDLDWHAARYDSVVHFMGLIALAKPPSSLTYAEIRDHIVAISRRCVDDGADYGEIPGLGGEPAKVWRILRDRN